MAHASDSKSFPVSLEPVSFVSLSLVAGVSSVVRPKSFISPACSVAGLWVIDLSRRPPGER